MSLESDVFAAMFVRAAHDAARHHGYPPPADAVVGELLARLPTGTRSEIGRGIVTGKVASTSRGDQFRLNSLGQLKGPYSWFSANRAAGHPGPNWEYFFQVAEFLRVSDLLGHGYTVGFEDGLMDISVRDGQRLVWYIEVKAKPTMIKPLLRSLQTHGQGVDLAAPDRGNDPLRKAKYLVRLLPPYLSIVGGESRRHFEVTVVGNTFTLTAMAASPESSLTGSNDETAV